MSQCTRVCGHSLQGQNGADEMDHGAVAGIGLIVAGCDASEFLNLAEEVLDQMAPPIHGVVTRNPAGTVVFGRDNGDRSTFCQFGAYPIDVECFVSQQGIELDPGDQRRNTNTVVALAGQQRKAHEVSQRIDESHDLGRQAAARFPYGLIESPPFAPAPCWWTRTMVPSIIAYSKSGSSERDWKTRSKTPFRAHRRKRRKVEFQLPNPGGRSLHGAPVRTIHSTASRNRRLSRPERPGSLDLPGRAGAIRSHCESVRIWRSKAGLLFPALNHFSAVIGIPLSGANECPQALVH